MHTMLTRLTILIGYRFGEDGYILTRPVIYDLIFRQIPKDRIHLGMKIVSTDQSSDCVRIRCSDGVEYKGDILVGADGAYSAVRRNLYAELMKEDMLPASDALPLPFKTFCLLGQTRKLDAIEFPDLAKDSCQFFSTLGDDNPYAVCSALKDSHCCKEKSWTTNVYLN